MWLCNYVERCSKQKLNQSPHHHPQHHRIYILDHHNIAVSRWWTGSWGKSEFTGERCSLSNRTLVKFRPLKTIKSIGFFSFSLNVFQILSILPAWRNFQNLRRNSENLHRLDVCLHILGSDVHRDQHPRSHLPHPPLAWIQENPALKHAMKNWETISNQLQICAILPLNQVISLLEAFAQDQKILPSSTQWKMPLQ